MTPENIRRITLDGQDGAPGPVVNMEPNGIAFTRETPVPALEIYPTQNGPSRGTVMISPGGGYVGLALEMEGRGVARMLNAAGWDAAVLLYHVNLGPDTRPLALDDARKALTLLQTRGGEFGLSTERVGAMGFSAGGHLSARLAHETAASGEPTPAFLVLIYPAYLHKEGVISGDTRPINAPVFLCVGDKDDHLQSSTVYAAACAARGGMCELVVLPDDVHGFLTVPYNADGTRGAWPDKLRAFLDALPTAAPHA